MRSPDPGDDEFEVVDVCPDCLGEGKIGVAPVAHGLPADHWEHAPDEPPAASEFGLGLPGAEPRDWTPSEARVADYLASRDGSLTPQSDRAKAWEVGQRSESWITSEITSPYYAGVGCDELGIFLHPAAWNCERLPGAEEARLAYFFKLMYMERLRQLKRWGDQRHPDGTNTSQDDTAHADLYRNITEELAREGRLTWRAILKEEIAETFACPPVLGPEDALRRDGESDLESEMVQSAAVLAAWHSDVCRRVWEAEGSGDDPDRYADTIADDISIEGAAAVAESLDEGMRGM